MLCKAALGYIQYCYLFLYMKCLGVNLLCLYISRFALQYTTTHLQILFSLQLLGRITKVFTVLTLNLINYKRFYSIALFSVWILQHNTTVQ